VKGRFAFTHSNRIYPQF
jgi:serine/threonine protein kinase